MALVLKDRVKETSSSTGTGDFVLAGAADGFQSFTDALADGDTTYYAIEDGTDWETGLGTWTESTSTLARTTVYESSNSGNAVDWGAGSKNVFITQPASRTATIAVYATIDDLPLTSNVQAGDQAYVSGNNRLYLYNGTGWFNIALINQTPTISGNEASYVLASDGTPTVITLAATDPEGIPITWSHIASGLDNEATVTNVDNVFTVTPSTDTANAGEFSITFRASDGVNIGTASSEFSLVFVSAYWDETVLSIGTSSTNGLANSTFIDRSTNASTVTTSGTPVQTAFHPYLDNWSVEFDGSGDYLSLTQTDGLTVGTGEFSIDCWMYPNFSPTGANVYALLDLYSTSSVINLRFYNNNLQSQLRTTSSSIHTLETSWNTDWEFQWNHIVLCRDTNNVTSLFVNGTRVATYTIEKNIGTFSSRNIGDDWNGNIANFRMNVGSTLFDPTQTSITIPTEKPSVTSDVTLLISGNRFTNISDHADAPVISVGGGTPKVSAFNPFGQGSEYAVGENKGSVYLNSSLVTITGDTTLAFGTGDFTVQAWVYLYGSCTIYDARPSSQNGAYLRMSASTTSWQVYVSGSTRIDTGTNYSQNEWHHVAYAKAGGTGRLYVDGVSVGSWSDATNYSNGSSRPIIGASGFSGSADANAHIADMQVVKGAALYTTNFTPPTAPVGDTNASLYLPFDNAGIYDKTGNNTLTLFGNVSTSTAQTKFADTAMYFDGSGDWVDIEDFGNIGTGDFTFESWFYLTDNTSNRALFDGRPSGTSSGPYITIQYRAGNSIGFYSSAWRIESTTVPSANTWYHIALCRSNGTTRLFINGTQEGSNYSDSTNYVYGRNAIGALYNDTNTWWKGYIENLQILKGIAKYTTNFTPPTSTQGSTYQAES